MTAYCKICGLFLYYLYMEDEYKQFLIQFCKLEIRRLQMQLTLAFSPEEKTKIELQIKKEKEALRRFELEQDF